MPNRVHFFKSSGPAWPDIIVKMGGAADIGNIGLAACRQASGSSMRRDLTSPIRPGPATPRPGPRSHRSRRQRAMTRSRCRGRMLRRPGPRRWPPAPFRHERKSGCRRNLARPWEARPWESRSQVSNAGRRPAQGSPLLLRSTSGNRRALIFNSARGSISSGRRLNSSPPPSDRFACRKTFRASPGNLPKSSPDAGGCGGTNMAGGAGARKGRGAKDARDAASWPASALIEKASAIPRHHGAMAPVAQPVRE